MSVLVLARRRYLIVAYRRYLLDRTRLRPHQIHLDRFRDVDELDERVEAALAEHPGLTGCIVDPGPFTDAGTHLESKAESGGWLARLVLGFPDLQIELWRGGAPPPEAVVRDALAAIYMEIGGHMGPGGAEAMARQALELASRQRHLFDPLGRRHAVRSRFFSAHDHMSGLSGADIAPLPTALVVDDEASFALVHAYACYLSGLNARVVWTAAQITSLKRPSGAPSQFALVVMDWNLCFEDAEGMPEAIGGQQAEATREAEVARSSIFALMGACEGADAEFSGLVVSALSEDLLKSAAPPNENDSYRIFKRLRALKRMHWMQKPIDGLLAFKAEISTIAGPTDDMDEVWAKALVPSGSRHTTPHVAKIVAERLLARVRAIDADGWSLEQHLRAAVMAREARSLLGQLARTTSFESLSLQHEMEVRAELVFVGFVGELDSKSRMRLLEHQADLLSPAPLGLRVIAGRFRRRKRSDRAVLNFLIGAVGRLRRLYGSNDQVAAADETLVNLSGYQRRLLLSCDDRYWLERAQKRLAYLGLLYFDLSTRAGTSIYRWFIALAVLAGMNGAIIALTILCWPGPAKPDPARTISAAAGSSVYALIGEGAYSVAQKRDRIFEQGTVKVSKQSPAAKASIQARMKVAQVVELIFRLLLGVVHIGFLLAILYRLIIRKAA